MSKSMIRKFQVEPGQIIGWVNGKPVRAVAGGAPEEGEQGGDGGEGGQGGSLLEEEAAGGAGDGGDGGSGDGGDGGDGGGDGGQAQADPALVQAVAAAVTQALESKFDSIADRRVNAILKEVRKQTGQQGGQGGGQQQQQEQHPQAPAVDQGVIRGARLAYREYVGSEIKFLGNQERDFAADMAARLLAERVAAEGPEADDDRIGREVAKDVAGQIKGLRKFYEDRTVKALKSRGLLPDEGTTQTTSPTAGKTGQPPKGATKPGDQSGFSAGAAKAQEMFGHRQPAAAQT